MLISISCMQRYYKIHQAALNDRNFCKQKAISRLVRRSPLAPSFKMKIAIAFVAAITLVTFTSAQPTTCTQDDINEFRNIAARVAQCLPSACSANQTPCQCCTAIRNSAGDSSNPGYSCCQEYATAVALYQQCKDVLNQQAGNNTNTAKQGNVYVNYQNCAITVVNNGVGETVRALSILAMLSTAVLASLLF